MNTNDVGCDQNKVHQMGWKVWWELWYPLTPQGSLSVKVSKAFPLFNKPIVLPRMRNSIGGALCRSVLFLWDKNGKAQYLTLAELEPLNEKLPWIWMKIREKGTVKDVPAVRDCLCWRLPILLSHLMAGACQCLFGHRHSPAAPLPCCFSSQMATRCSTIKLTQKTMQNLSKRGSASMRKASDLSQSPPSSQFTVPE